MSSRKSNETSIGLNKAATLNYCTLKARQFVSFLKATQKEQQQNPSQCYDGALKLNEGQLKTAH